MTSSHNQIISLYSSLTSLLALFLTDKSFKIIISILYFFCDDSRPKGNDWALLFTFFLLVFSKFPSYDLLLKRFFLSSVLSSYLEDDFFFIGVVFIFLCF